MRILLLSHSFNSLTQRLHAELREDGHEVSVELDIADQVTVEAVSLYSPDVVIAPFLKRAVPREVWQNVLTLIVHPGVVGDRGPSALDHAILQGQSRWGVTVLQAEAEMDAGPVWAHAGFALPGDATKAGLYRGKVTSAALAAVREALSHYPAWRAGSWQAWRVDYADPAVPGRPHTPVRAEDRMLDWAGMSAAELVVRARAADGFPGAVANLFDERCRVFDVRPGPSIFSDVSPGTVFGRCHDTLLVAARDGCVWVGQVKRPSHVHPFKLPAALAFASEADGLPLVQPQQGGDLDIDYRESDDGFVGYLAFDFYNGAMGVPECLRLMDALKSARARPTRVLVLLGGEGFWSNGIHLGRIEAADSPAEASWDNICAMNDVCQLLLENTAQYQIAALRGNAGAGGCFLALACDEVWASDGVLLNPHYRNMGNLYGSEYWTYLLPKRVGTQGAQAIMRERLPITATMASQRGLIDMVHAGTSAQFLSVVECAAQSLAMSDARSKLAARLLERQQDEALKPLASYRQEELERMRQNFFGFDPSYHVARYHFIMKTPQSWTPRHLAVHREKVVSGVSVGQAPVRVSAPDCVSSVSGVRS